MESEAVKIAKTATDGLKLLWGEGFFRDWKNWASINDSLSKKGNHFGDTELGMALKRAKYLTRRGKPGGFEYVQKYQFVLEVSGAANSKKGGKS
jgi:hypothetical protein